MIAVGKIFFLDSLVALAIYENKYCNNFLVKSDLVEELYSKHYYMIPDVLNDKGLLGTDTDFYDYLSGYWYRSTHELTAEIRYEKLIELTDKQVERLIGDNKHLIPR